MDGGGDDEEWKGVGGEDGPKGGEFEGGVEGGGGFFRSAVGELGEIRAGETDHGENP